MTQECLSECRAIQGYAKFDPPARSDIQNLLVFLGPAKGSNVSQIFGLLTGPKPRSIEKSQKESSNPLRLCG